MKSFYPKGNWVKWKSRIEESVESLIKWAFEKTVNKSWQNRWECNLIHSPQAYKFVDEFIKIKSKERRNPCGFGAFCIEELSRNELSLGN